ncbi:hypothetical protein BZA05DRAFT_471699 [Tricharina praecox]|uniref:uncharacterized protein n=1 Tax=Tricharina praecox TaxID=43433 RepID=UPI00221E563B|nr:uncharacterized protein BZA05DRAFT_471699 [Tricharina praecox]KAI5855680.1 hypothetical protein BZA05DRAFT_471699 [Tricharina praecox]
MRLFGYRSADTTLGLLWTLSFFASTSAAVLGRRQEVVVCSASELRCTVAGAPQFCCPASLQCGTVRNSCIDKASPTGLLTASNTVADTKSINTSSPSPSISSGAYPSSLASGTANPTATASTAAATLGQDKSAKPPIIIIAIAASAGSLLIITLVSYFCYRKRKQGRQMLAAYEDPKRKPYGSVILGSGEKALSLRELPSPPPTARATLSDDVLAMSLKPAGLKETDHAPTVQVENPAGTVEAGITVCKPCLKPASCGETENEMQLAPPIELHPAFSKFLEPQSYDIYSPESPGCLQMSPQEAAGPLEDGGHTAGNGDNGFCPQESSLPRIETPPFNPPPHTPRTPLTPQEYNQDIFQEYLQDFQEDMEEEYIEESPSMWNQQAEFPAPGGPRFNKQRDSYADTADIYASYAPQGSLEIHCPSPTYPQDMSLPQRLETPNHSPRTPPPLSPLRGHWSQQPAPRELTPPQRPMTAHMTPPTLQPQPRFPVTTTPPPPNTPPRPKTASPSRPPRGPDVYVPLEMVIHYPQMIMPHAL